jgi:hypothetical protein
MKVVDYKEFSQRVTDFEEAESLARTRLIRRARAGDRIALARLLERYNLRLPLVERMLNYQPGAPGTN